ncbi:MAG: hypothetical protein JW759_08940 [Candidatus Coatesbacteria bacterium]|nr:hypothetical protein [Candidatus Coatesbacteria bacterium]
MHTLAIDTLLSEILAVRGNENLLIIANEGESAGLAAEIAQRAGERERQASIAVMALSRHFYVEPSAEVAAKMRSASVILELASNSTYYSRAVREALSQGARIFFLSGIGAAAFEALMLQVNSTEVHALGQRLLALLRRSKRIEMLSGSGCALWASLGAAWAREMLQFPVFRRHLNAFFDSPSGLCRASGSVSSLAGQVSFSGLRATINGRVNVDGAVFPPQQDCPLEAQLEVEVRAGRVVNVGASPAGRRLVRWMDENSRNGGREVMHFSLGLNPGARLGESILVNERIFGALTIGVGYGVRHAHTDLVTTSPSVWLDQKPLFIGAELVHPELAFLKSALTRPSPQAQ